MERPGSVTTPSGTGPVPISSASVVRELRPSEFDDDGRFAEAFAQLNDGLAVMKSIVKDMDAAIKKQPNVSKVIKVSIPKLEENLDKLEYLARTWPKSRRLGDPVIVNSLSKEGGKRSAASPPIMDMQKGAKKVKSDGRTRKPESASETPLKKIEAAVATSLETAQTPANEWTIVAKKRASRDGEKTTSQVSAISIMKENKKKKKKHRKRGGVRRRERLDAILLKPVEGKTYADVLTAVRTKVNPDNCGVQVKSVRKTKAGELLLELQKSSIENRNAFQLALKEAAGESSAVRELVSKVKLEVRDIDDCTSVEDVKVALQNVLEDYKGTIDISLTKSNGRGQRMAIASMEKTAAKVLLQQGKVKIGWVNCSIRSRIDIYKCFKCLGYGHLGSICKGPDRSNRCFHCGAEGHKAKDCKSQPNCYLCIDKDGNGRKHLAGSGACEAFRKALEHAKRSK